MAKAKHSSSIVHKPASLLMNGWIKPAGYVHQQEKSV